MKAYGDFASVYDRLTLNVDYDEIAAAIVGMLKEQGVDAGLVLDLACGTGSLIRRLTLAGYELIGADGSSEMLVCARRKLEDAGQKALLLCQEMTGLDLYGTVKAAVCTLDGLNHLPDTDSLRRTLERLRLFIEPDGIFIFDVNTPYKHREVLKDNTFVYDLDDLFCVWQNATGDSLKTRMTLDVFVKEKGGRFLRFTEEFSERAFSDEEIAAALERSGFQILGLFDGYSGRPLCETSQRAVYLTKRI